MICISDFTNLQAQDWVLKNSNTTDDIVDMYFKDEALGFFLTNAGKIYQTTDGGENWDFFYQDTDIELAIFDIENSIVCTNDSVFCYSSNFPASTTTTRLKSPILSPIFSKDTLAGRVSDPQFWHNEIWSAEKVNEKLGLPDAVEHYHIYGDYISASTATIVFFSNDFGETWNMSQFTTSPLSSQPYHSFYDGTSYPIAITNYPVTIYFTSDGATWNFIQPGGNSNFYFISRDIAYTFNPITNMLIYSSNAFSSFNNYAFPSNILGIYFEIPELGFVFGKNGMLYKTTNGGGLLGVKGGAVLKGVKIYPNPTNNILHIDVSDNVVVKEISITDTKGQVLKICKKHETDIDIGFLSTGVYCLSIKTKQGVFCEKFIKK